MVRAYTSRTPAETFARCNRRRYLSQHFGGTGIESVKKSLPLAVGSSVHKGLAELLRAGQEAVNKYGSITAVPNPIWLEIEDRAVALALEDFSQYKNLLELDTTEQPQQNVAITPNSGLT